MRSLFLIALTAAALSASAETANLTCTIAGKVAGTAAFSIVQGPNRTFVQTTIFKISRNGVQDELTSEVKVNFDGMTLQDDEKETVNGAVQRNVSVQFTVKGANVTNKATGEKKFYPVPPGENIKDLGGLWFVSIRPHIGAKSSATAFATDSLSWKKTSRTYVADKTVTAGGLKVVGHELQDEDGTQSITSIIDDHGLPIQVDIADFHFARK